MNPLLDEAFVSPSSPFRLLLWYIYHTPLVPFPRSKQLFWSSYLYKKK